MAFTVTLWQYNKRTNSTARPSTSGMVATCVSNETLDMANPVLPLNIGATANPTRYNYAYINAFERYYWITGWEFSGGLWIATCSVDVLASWRTEIGQQTCYVGRAAADFDGRLMDTTYPNTADFTVRSSGYILRDTDQLPWTTDGTTGTYVMGIIGRGGAVNYWAFPQSNYAAFMREVFNYNYGFEQEQIKAVFNPIQYITSITWLPFGYQSTGTTSVEFGWWTIGGPGSGGYLLGTGQVHSFSATIALPKHPQQARGVWLNGPSNTRYLLKVPCYGVLDIQGADMLDSTSVTLSVDVDMPTGAAILYVKPSAAPANTQVISYQAGVPVQVSQITSNMLGQGINALRNNGGLVGRIIGDALAGAAGGLQGTIGSIGAISLDMGDKVSSSGTNGSRAAAMIDGELITICQLIAEENLEDRGRPLCQRRQLSSLPGFQQVLDTDIQIACTAEEMDSIKGYLAGGYFYE